MEEMPHMEHSFISYEKCKMKKITVKKENFGSQKQKVGNLVL